MKLVLQRRDFVLLLAYAPMPKDVEPILVSTANSLTTIPLPPDMSTVKKHSVSLAGSTALLAPPSSQLLITIDSRVLKLTNLSTGKQICSVSFQMSCAGAIVKGESMWVREGDKLHCLSLNPLKGVWEADAPASGRCWDASEDFVAVENPSSDESGAEGSGGASGGGVGVVRILDTRNSGKLLNEGKLHGKGLAVMKIHAHRGVDMLVSSSLPSTSIKVFKLPTLEILQVLYRGSVAKEIKIVDCWEGLVAAAGSETVHVWSIDDEEGCSASKWREGDRLGAGGAEEVGSGIEGNSGRVAKRNILSASFEKGLAAMSPSLINGKRSFYKFPAPSSTETVRLSGSSRVQVNEEGEKVFCVTTVGGGKVKCFEWDGKVGRGILDENI